MLKHSLWVEKYRTNDIEDFVAEESFKNDIKKYIENNDLPHLIFWGDTGCGKTTIIKLLSQNIDCDYLFLNASDENSIDDIRGKVKNFASSASFRKLKLVLLDEAGNLSSEAQAALYNMIEVFSQKTRFLFTTNHIEKIAKPIQSRCVVYNLKPPSQEEVFFRCMSILESEDIRYLQEDVKTTISILYPDIRKIINTLQNISLSGDLIIAEVTKNDYLEKVLEILDNKSDKKSWTSIRQILVDNDVKDYKNLYKALYEKYIENPRIIVLLANYQFKEKHGVDSEINTSGLIHELIVELNKK